MLFTAIDTKLEKSGARLIHLAPENLTLKLLEFIIQMICSGITQFKMDASG